MHLVEKADGIELGTLLGIIEFGKPGKVIDDLFVAASLWIWR